jgi:hypothetical protein
VKVGRGSLSEVMKVLWLRAREGYDCVVWREGCRCMVTACVGLPVVGVSQRKSLQTHDWRKMEEHLRLF